MSNISPSSPLPSLGSHPLWDPSHFLFPILCPSDLSVQIPQFQGRPFAQAHLPCSYLHPKSPQVFTQIPKGPPSPGGSDRFSRAGEGGEILSFPAPPSSENLTSNTGVQDAGLRGLLQNSLPRCISWDAGCGGSRNEMRRSFHNRPPGQTPNLGRDTSFKIDFRRTRF